MKGILCLAAAAWPYAGCVDPVIDAAITALGPEDPAVAVGPLHRPSQPCVLCHDGERASRFSVAGTVYTQPEGAETAPGVMVELIDAVGRHATRSNCAGNFFVRNTEFAPTYPLWTALSYGDYRIDMQSPIGRDGSCAACHAATQQSKTDVVYLYSLGETLSDRGDCP
jgi:hypothetical protein